MSADSSCQEALTNLLQADKKALDRLNKAEEQANARGDEAREKAESQLEKARAEAESEAESIVADTLADVKERPDQLIQETALESEKQKPYLTDPEVLRQQADKHQAAAVDQLVAWVTAKGV